MSASLHPITPIPVVTPGAFLTLHYRLSSSDGAITLVDTFAAKPATLTIGDGLLAPALEQCLLGLAEGESRRFELAGDAAFGAHHPDKVRWVSGALLDELHPDAEPLQVGDSLQFPAPPGAAEGQVGFAGGQASFAGLILAIEQGRVLFDFNHPLAGRGAVFEVAILAVL